MRARARSKALRAPIVPKSQRRRRLVDVVATVIRRGMETGQPSHFAFEGHLRHVIRSNLCLQGWKWPAADVASAEVVAAALKQVGAKRPPWKEGQPEYVQFGVLMFERTRCVTCGGRLPEGHKLYCSRICYFVKESERRSSWESSYDKAVRYAAHWRTRHAASEPC